MKEKTKDAIIAIGSLVLVFGLLMTVGIINGLLHVTACKELGYDGYSIKDDFTFCTDEESNLYSVQFYHTDFFGFDLKAKRISINIEADAE